MNQTNGSVGDAFRDIYTTSAVRLDKHLLISDYCSMYTSLVILLALAACAATAPADDVTSITSQNQKDPNPDGSKSNHEASNNTKVEKEGHLEDAGAKKEAQTTKDDEDYYDFDYGRDNHTITVSPLLFENVINHRFDFRG